MKTVSALLNKLKKKGFSVIPSKIDPFTHVALRPGKLKGDCVLFSNSLEGTDNYADVLNRGAYYQIYLYESKNGRWYKWEQNKFVSLKGDPFP